MEIKWLYDKFLSYKDQQAIVWKDKSYSYKWLIDSIDKWRSVMKLREIAPGQVIAIEGDYSPEISALFIALIENNCIIVPLSSATESNKEEFIDIANVWGVFRFDEMDNWEYEEVANQISNPLLLALSAEKETGLILFSSGSTGKSKGALHRLDKLLNKYKDTQKTMRTLVFLLIDHIGGINTLFYILANGGTMIIERSKKTLDICKAIERHRVELLPTSPTFINLLLISQDYQNCDLSSLKMITYGTEPMPEFTLKKANEVFQGVKLKQTYGLSELGIMATKSEDNGSLWVKLGGDGYETKVEDGILYIKAESSMLGYLNAPSPFDKNGWFNTQDLVIQKGDYYKILGRQSEIINVGGEKVYPAEVESIILQLDNVKDVIVRGEKNPIMGNIVCATINLINPEDMISLKKRIRTHCKDHLEDFKIPVKISIGEAELFNQRYKRMRREM